jgi:two-component system chemotaxis sensor kinase CheA
VKTIPVFAGAAILGDGQVALVLDVLGLAQRSGVISGTRSRMLGEQETPTQSAQAIAEGLLLFSPRAGGQMAIPLSAVARLEEFSSTDVEYVGNSRVAQYRGEILPLIDVSQELDRLGRTDRMLQKPDADDRTQPSSAETLPVIVCADGERRVGLIVAKVLDIVHEQIAMKSQSSRPGVLFAAVLQEKVTEFVDIATLARTTSFNHSSVT